MTQINYRYDICEKEDRETSFPLTELLLLYYSKSNRLQYELVAHKK